MWRTGFLLLACLLLACEGAPQNASMTADTADGSGDTNAAPVTAANDTSAAAECTLVEQGFGPSGSEEVQVEEVASGLEVPWGIAFLPGDGMLVTERSGAVRIVRGGQVAPQPVATVDAAASGEGGLLGIAIHPDFDENRQFYVYYTTSSDNRVERWTLSDDGSSAARDRIILDGIPSARFHNGGRLRFGPDDMLYIGTGDARNAELSQDRSSLAGKILRITPDGEIPSDNPYPDSPVYLMGIRNTQGFDWPAGGETIWIADHGPSGEMGLQGHDEVSLARAGDNLGWPEIYGCETAPDMIAPVLTWQTAVPPGGAAIYEGSAMADWQGDLLVGTLGSRHLHRVSISGGVADHAVYLRGDEPDGYGRLREVIMGPDDRLYITTSNCDGRGTCPSDGDKILRIR